MSNDTGFPADPNARPHFVWIRSMVGIWPQKWAALDFGERDHLKRSVVAAHPLTDEEAELTVDGLARRYPLPAEWQDPVNGGER